MPKLRWYNIALYKLNRLCLIQRDHSTSDSDVNNSSILGILLSFFWEPSRPLKFFRASSENTLDLLNKFPNILTSVPWEKKSSRYCSAALFLTKSCHQFLLQSHRFFVLHEPFCFFLSLLSYYPPFFLGELPRWLSGKESHCSAEAAGMSVRS